MATIAKRVIDPGDREICTRRGHDTGGTAFTGLWHQCKWCGIWVREVRVIEERHDEPPEKEQHPMDRLKRSGFGDSETE